jgi:LysR family transcriptional regulator, benzoate and cis,cis-muconate-responsive activator of ben and cat genes
MELRHLRYFVAVAELLNFTKAAARLNVAQPALSRQIKDLEDELGVRLFERSSRFVDLTDAGKTFVSEARSVLQRAELAAQSVRVFATGDHGEIHLGYAPSPTVELLPKLLQAFEQQFPGVRVNLHDLSVQEMFQGLRERRLDAALTIHSSPRQMRGLVFEGLRIYPVCLAVHKKHPLAQAQCVNLAQIEPERLMVYSRAEYPDYHEWLKKVYEEANKTPPANVEEHDSGTGIMAAVEAGRGVALVPSILSCVAGPRLVFLGLHPSPQPFIIGVAYHRRHLSPAARRFIRVAIALKS